MKANEVYQRKADQLYAQIGHAIMQKKQLEEGIEELELQLKALVLSNPLLQQVEAELSNEPE
jgi:outer membrane protein assembly factor BamD (BamD/ComL family)